MSAKILQGENAEGPPYLLNFSHKGTDYEHSSTGAAVFSMNYQPTVCFLDHSLPPVFFLFQLITTTVSPPRIQNPVKHLRWSFLQK